MSGGFCLHEKCGTVRMVFMGIFSFFKGRNVMSCQECVEIKGVETAGSVPEAVQLLEKRKCSLVAVLASRNNAGPSIVCYRECTHADRVIRAAFPEDDIRSSDITVDGSLCRQYVVQSAKYLSLQGIQEDLKKYL